MSIFGQWVAATIAAGAAESAVVDLGREYDYLSIQIPGMDACKLYLKVAETVGGTFYELGKETTTEVETFNRADVWRLGGWRFVKVVASQPQTGQRLIRICGMRY